MVLCLWNHHLHWHARFLLPCMPSQIWWHAMHGKSFQPLKWNVELHKMWWGLPKMSVLLCAEIWNAWQQRATATELMGVQAKDLFILSSDLDAIHELCARVSCHPFLFTLSVKTNSFNGVDRLKFVLINSEEISYGSACSVLLQDIERMSTTSVVFCLWNSFLFPMPCWSVKNNFYMIFRSLSFRPLLPSSSLHFTIVLLSFMYIHLCYMLQLPPLHNSSSFTFTWSIYSFFFYLLNKIECLYPFKVCFAQLNTNTGFFINNCCFLIINLFGKSMINSYRSPQKILHWNKFDFNNKISMARH